VHEPGPARDHTERMLKARGVKLEVRQGTATLHPDAVSQDWIPRCPEISPLLLSSSLRAAWCLNPRL